MATPWSWRATRHTRHSIPWKGDMRKYRAGIGDLIKMIRTIDTNRCCADCGVHHNPQGPMDMATPYSNGVAYANPWLGVFICHDCAKYHEELLPSPLNKVYDLHQWSLDDVAQMARWGNLRNQRYWLGKFRVEIHRWPELIKPDRSAMTRKQWISRKYIQREWALESLPCNPEFLCPINLFEQRCFKQLRIMGWVPPLTKLPSPSPQATTNSSEEKVSNTDLSQKRPSSRVSTSSKRSSYKDILMVSPQRDGTTTEMMVRVARDIFATKHLGQPPSDYVSPTPSPSTRISTELKSPKLPNPTTISLSRPTSKIRKQPPSPRPQSPCSDFSDDLYGTGRPLRPGLINPSSAIHEWRISSIGNPPLSVSPLEPWEERPLAPPPTIKNHPLHEWTLIPIEGDNCLHVGSGDTVTEEDSSILAELNEAFINCRENMKEEVGMEDDVTEVGSEVEKIVFEFGGTEVHIQKGETNVEGDEGEEEVGLFEAENLEGGFVNCGSKVQGNTSDAEVILETRFIWEGNPDSEESGIQEDRRNDTAEETCSPSHEISEEQTEITEKNTPPAEIQDETSPGSRVLESCVETRNDSNTEYKQDDFSCDLTKDALDSHSATRPDPFAKVVLNLKSGGNKICDTSDGPCLDEAGKQDLRLFLLRSGLFSK